MIVRELQDGHLMARQPEHARQSAVITAALRQEFVGTDSEREEIIAATKQHDDGWREWEANPRFREDGLPQNFPDIGEKCHQDIWFRTIELARQSLSPLAAAVVARQAGTFLQAYGGEAQRRYAELLPALLDAAWPDQPRESQERKLERSFAPLLVGDTLSLIPIAGWGEMRRFVLFMEDDTEFVFHAWREGEWTVRIEPWPFKTPGLRNVYIRAYHVPRGREEEASAILQDPGSHLIRLYVDYLPVK